jgi:hypothetical protein
MYFASTTTDSSNGDIYAPAPNVQVLLLGLACVPHPGCEGPSRCGPREAGWMVGALVLWYASAQSALWTPSGLAKEWS